MPVCAFRNGTLLSPPSRRPTISASAFLHRHRFSPSSSSSSMCAFFLGFMLIALIWKFDFSPFMVLIISILNAETIMAISKDRVVPFPTPDSSKMNENFATGGVLAAYQAVMTVVFFWFIN